MNLVQTLGCPTYILHHFSVSVCLPPACLMSHARFKMVLHVLSKFKGHPNLTSITGKTTNSYSFSLALCAYGQYKLRTTTPSDAEVIVPARKERNELYKVLNKK
mmetsp:Transcript_8507/g.14601  ORF Transcript_8507/g.14601 Transcript_8507/m.14601 type:complete len:104 (+) Transcript_8507:145-456(+)